MRYWKRSGIGSATKRKESEEWGNKEEREYWWGGNQRQAEGAKIKIKNVTKTKKTTKKTENGPTVGRTDEQKNPKLISRHQKRARDWLDDRRNENRRDWTDEQNLYASENDQLEISVAKFHTLTLGDDGNMRKKGAEGKGV